MVGRVKPDEGVRNSSRIESLEIGMGWEDRIVIDEKVLVGKPVIRGTRLAVEFIIDLLHQGWSEADILRNYPGVTRDDILACLGYASAMLHAERVYPLTV